LLDLFLLLVESLVLRGVQICGVLDFIVKVIVKLVFILVWGGQEEGRVES
jgi:hypothetical protein